MSTTEIARAVPAADRERRHCHPAVPTPRGDPAPRRRRAAAGQHKDFRPSPAGWLARGVVWAVVAWIVLASPVNILSPASRSASPNRRGLASRRLRHRRPLAQRPDRLLRPDLASAIRRSSASAPSRRPMSSPTSSQRSGWRVIVAAARRRPPGRAARRCVASGDRALLRAHHPVLRHDGAGERSSTSSPSPAARAASDAPRPTGFNSAYGYYYVCLGFLALVLWLDWRLTRTKAGRALLALRENPRVAATLGIDVRAYTVVAFMVSGFFAGIGGALFAHRDEFRRGRAVHVPARPLFIIMTVVGGLRNRSGSCSGRRSSPCWATASW